MRFIAGYLAQSSVPVLGVAAHFKNTGEVVAVGFSDLNANAFSRDRRECVAAQPLMIALHAGKLLPSQVVFSLIYQRILFDGLGLWGADNILISTVGRRERQFANKSRIEGQLYSPQRLRFVP